MRACSACTATPCPESGTEERERLGEQIHSYAGNPASFPTNVGLVDDSDLNPATAATLDVSGENLADRTAYLKARSLDKTGDTITGHVHIGAGAELEVDPTGTIVVDHDASILLQPSGGVGSNPGTMFVQGLLEIQGGGKLNIDLGGTGTINGQLSSAVPGGIQSSVPGGISLGGGSTDFVGTGSVRTKKSLDIPCPVNPRQIDGTNWDIQSGLLISESNAGTTLQLRIPGLHQGALLSTVTLYFAVQGAHSAVPATLPNLAVYRRRTNTGATIPAMDPLSTAPGNIQAFTPAPANAAAWVDSNQVQALTFSCNQNNVIDLTQYTYLLFLSDESGAGSVFGNQYVSIAAVHTNIANMNFQDGG